MSDKPLVIERPTLSDPVLIELFEDGVKRELKYSIGTLQRIKQANGKAVMGLRGSLLDLDESILPLLIYEGLRHEPKRGVLCQCGHHAENGIDPDVSMDDLIALEAYMFNYLLTNFSIAYTASRPTPKKNDPEGTAKAIIDRLLETTTTPS